MKKRERLAAIVLMVIGLGAIIGAFDIGFGTFNNPGPGFYPFWLALLLTIASGALLIANLNSDGEKMVLWNKGSWVRPLIGVLIMLAYGFLMNWLGFFSATFLMFMTWMTIIGGEKPQKSLMVSIGIVIFVYLLFVLFLQVQLPDGILI